MSQPPADAMGSDRALRLLMKLRRGCGPKGLMTHADLEILGLPNSTTTDVIEPVPQSR